ncbi:hypothetical protein WA026_021119 [Henosepilachna vigintioctopunctata]|uniref:Retrotransposon gag domain-containing protein n=1 Tax=Henosepilachna vigintioctopunctata TaxID=420089 RepID=A0AAW1V4R3_9CUCU
MGNSQHKQEEIIVEAAGSGNNQAAESATQRIDRTEWLAMAHFCIIAIIVAVMGWRKIKAALRSVIRQEVRSSEMGKSRQQLDDRVDVWETTRGCVQLKTASSLLPKLDGKIETIHHLIEGIELYESALDQINKPLLVNYVLKACIGHVEKIRLKQSYNSVDELIADIKTHFLPKQSASALAARLQACQQGSTDIEEYGRSIEILMPELTIAQAGNDARALEIFKGANEKIAVDVFARGIKNFETRTIIKSRNFNKLSDAIIAAKEEAVLHQQNASVLHFKDQYRGQGRGRGRFFNNRGRQNFKGRGTFNNNHNNGNINYNSNYNQKSRQNNYRGHNNRDNNYRIRQNNHRGNINSNSNRGNVFLAENVDSERQQFFRANDRK